MELVLTLFIGCLTLGSSIVLGLGAMCLIIACGTVSKDPEGSKGLGVVLLLLFIAFLIWI
jgi:hypothetical protein